VIVGINHATHLRFFVASAKILIISGKSYKASEETTDCGQDPAFLKTTKQAA
jgi:hypothetical protein